MFRFFLKLTIPFSALFMFAMSNSPKEELKQPELLGPYVEVQTGEGFITLDELHRIAINYYKYRFEEEHEWKGMKRNEGESVIKNIIKFKADSLILAYMVNFNPTGNVLIFSSKKYGGPTSTHGSDTWKIDGNEMSVYSKSLHMVIRRMFRDLLDDIKNNNLSKNDKYHDQWEKFLVQPEQFNEQIQYENNTYQPDWWLEKKQAKSEEE